MVTWTGDEGKEQLGLFSEHPYGEVPRVRGSDTSEAAAESVDEKAPTLRRRVWSLLSDRGDHGATDDEIEIALEMSHQSASARRRELVLAGLAKDSGKRRRTRSGRTATVWIATRPSHG